MRKKRRVTKEVKNEYKHTQIGYLFDVLLSISLLTSLFIGVVYKFTPIVLALFIFLLLSLVLFPSLTIEIDKNKLTIRFGLEFLVKILI